MFPYTGNGPYCFTNSLHMCLGAAGMEDVPAPGFLECLSTMPFGKALYDEPDVFFFPAPPMFDPDAGLTRAVENLGWACDETFGGTEAEALARLREAVRQGVVLAGPLDMGGLTHNPNHANLGGSDHFVTVLSLDDTQVRIHDPAGFPYATLPVSDFVEAWRGERVPYGRRPFMLRSNFRQVESLTRAQMITRALPAIRTNLTTHPGVPHVFGGVDALCTLADALRREVSPGLRGHLVWFVLPMAARRLNDAASFLTEAGLNEAAACAAEQSRLFGEVLYPAVHNQWSQAADIVERIAEVESRWVALA